MAFEFAGKARAAALVVSRRWMLALTSATPFSQG